MLQAHAGTKRCLSLLRPKDRNTEVDDDNWGNRIVNLTNLADLLNICVNGHSASHRTSITKCNVADFGLGPKVTVRCRRCKF